MTADDFREIALSMQGAIERAHMGHPDFRANGKIFATLQADDQRGMVKVAPDEQRVLLREYPKTFTPASGAWGRQGCTMVQILPSSLLLLKNRPLLPRAISLPQQE